MMRENTQSAAAGYAGREIASFPLSKHNLQAGFARCSAARGTSPFRRRAERHGEELQVVAFAYGTITIASCPTIVAP